MFGYSPGNVLSPRCNTRYIDTEIQKWKLIPVSLLSSWLPILLKLSFRDIRVINGNYSVSSCTSTAHWVDVLYGVRLTDSVLPLSFVPLRYLSLSSFIGVLTTWGIIGILIFSGVATWVPTLHPPTQTPSSQSAWKGQDRLQWETSWW